MEAEAIEEERKKDQELVKSVKDLSDEVEEKYDKKINNLGPEEKEEPDFSDLKSRYDELKKKVSEARRDGKDMFVPHNLLLSFNSKLRIAKATEETEDVKEVENLLEEVAEEYTKAMDAKEVDVRKDILDRLKKEGVIEDEEDEEKKTFFEELSGTIDIDREAESSSKYFHMPDRELKTIRDLMEYLPEMSRNLFEYYYVSDGVNDFAKWINDVFGQHELAKQIRKVRDKKEVARIIKEAAGELND